MVGDCLPFYLQTILINVILYSTESRFYFNRLGVCTEIGSHARSTILAILCYEMKFLHIQNKCRDLVIVARLGGNADVQYMRSMISFVIAYEIN